MGWKGQRSRAAPYEHRPRKTGAPCHAADGAPQDLRGGAVVQGALLWVGVPRRAQGMSQGLRQEMGAKATYTFWRQPGVAIGFASFFSLNLSLHPVAYNKAHHPCCGVPWHQRTVLPGRCELKKIPIVAPQTEAVPIKNTGWPYYSPSLKGGGMPYSLKPTTSFEW